MPARKDAALLLGPNENAAAGPLREMMMMMFKYQQETTAYDLNLDTIQIAWTKRTKETRHSTTPSLP